MLHRPVLLLTATSLPPSPDLSTLPYLDADGLHCRVENLRSTIFALNLVPAQTIYLPRLQDLTGISSPP